MSRGGALSAERLFNMPESSEAGEESFSKLKERRMDMRKQKYEQTKEELLGHIKSSVCFVFFSMKTGDSVA